jgi:SAM-dependent methyltransferase
MAAGRSKRRGTSPKDWFSGVDDDIWFWMNTQGRRRFKSIAAIVPGLPDATLQATYTGNAEDATLSEGFTVYRICKRLYESHVGTLAKARVLDFGCGWGRMIRFFLREVPPARLIGVDFSAEAIEACRATNRWCDFRLIDPQPPTLLDAGTFDLIYLYSVFSHLPEEMHWALLYEFHRLLSPGGLLIATTWPREYILHCKSLRESPDIQNKPHWQSLPATVFKDTKASLSAYDSGGFCYEEFGVDGLWSFWGEACISREYVERRWTETFHVLEYIDDRKVCAQNMIVARKPLEQVLTHNPCDY